MLVSLVLFLIAIYDLLFHRIPNLSLVILIFVSLASSHQPFELRYLLLTGFAIALFTIISKCGFGDSKLAMIALNLIVPRTAIVDFLFCLTLAITLLVCVHLVRLRTWRGEIAFAPALCGAVLALLP